jgi:hypothetical protein
MSLTIQCWNSGTIHLNLIYLAFCLALIWIERLSVEEWYARSPPLPVYLLDILFLLVLLLSQVLKIYCVI